jgi:hypothetical protein
MRFGLVLLVVCAISVLAICPENPSKLSRNHCYSENDVQLYLDSANQGSWSAAWKLEAYWGYCCLNQDSMKYWWGVSDSLGNYWPRHFRILKQLDAKRPQCARLQKEIRNMKWVVRDSDFVRDSLSLEKKWTHRCSVK